MALESGTYISDLVSSNPAGGDSIGQGDDHIRLIKDTLTTTFPNVTGEVSATHTEINKLDGVTASTAELNKVVKGSEIYFSAEVRLYAGSSEPSGWFFCNGQAVSRTTYSDLFSAIGTTFGSGDGSTTFNLPDLRDRSPLGTATMGSSDAGRVGNYSTALGDTGGEDEHQLTEAELASHRHTEEAEAGAGTGSAGGSDRGNVTQNSGSAGEDEPHNNMHPFLAINFIIKT